MDWDKITIAAIWFVCGVYYAMNKQIKLEEKS